MSTHPARCRCGAIIVTATGTPTRVSICHCRNCQKRSGSAFSAQVRFASGDVTIAGRATTWRTTGDSGRWAEYRFCPTCGDQLFYQNECFPGVTAVPLGVFDYPHAFTPSVSVWENRKHDWIAITGDIEHH